VPDVQTGYGTLIALLIVIGISVWLGGQAQKVVEKGSFLKGYFLGNRGLGAWAMALTATVQSGGTFMGFPSLVYSHGWVVALWISSYMVVPIIGFSVLGKRFAQLSRRTGAITVPDMFRARFDNAGLGLAASLFIICFMSFLMLAQFKAGAIVMKLAWPGNGALALSEELGPGGVDKAYLIGLGVFAVTVVGYTLIGGFLASVWTDLFQSILMIIGVLVLFALVVPLTNQTEMANMTTRAVAATGSDFAFGPGYAKDGRLFLPLSLAISYFFVWGLSGVGNPSGMVRVMASKDTATLRRSVVLLAVYNFFIYVPLIILCIAARSIMPDLKNTDETIPRLAIWATREWSGGSLVSGLIMAAPFGAVMATVSSYLVMIASGLVRDVYQHFIRPQATDHEMKWLSYGVMIILGLIGVAANISPVQYLQALIIFSSTTTSATFLAPALMTAYWRRATVPGMYAAMFTGASVMLSLSIAGWLGEDPMIDVATRFRPYFAFGLHPIVYGLPASVVAGVVVSLMTKPPREELISHLFDSPASTAK